MKRTLNLLAFGFFTAIYLLYALFFSGVKSICCDRNGTLAVAIDTIGMKKIAIFQENEHKIIPEIPIETSSSFSIYFRDDMIYVLMSRSGKKYAYDFKGNLIGEGTYSAEELKNVTNSVQCGDKEYRHKLFFGIDRITNNHGVNILRNNGEIYFHKMLYPTIFYVVILTCFLIMLYRQKEEKDVQS